MHPRVINEQMVSPNQHSITFGPKQNMTWGVGF